MRPASDPTGEGKSAALCWASYFYTNHNPGAHGLCLRDTWENLQRTTLEEFFHWFPDGVYGQWVGTKKTWYWDKKRTGLDGQLTFMGAESQADAQRIASMPLAYILMDEPAPASATDSGGVGSNGIDKFVFTTAMAQLRQPGMKWYAAKLATNNPDESHWTYTDFVRPGTPPDPNRIPGVNMPELQESGYRCWQTKEPENVDNLPPGYYESMLARWKDRPDLVRRFISGKFGFQSKGKAVTPEWNDEIHLATGLEPIKGLPLKLGWDGGHNPTCIISQITPLGDWIVTDSFVLGGYGMYELIDTVIKARLVERYPWVINQPAQFLRHTGDPNLETAGEASTTHALSSAHRVILGELGGVWTPGPIDEAGRIEPLRGVLRKQRDGRGMLLVDRDHAEEVWFALRGGWHYRVQKSGVVGGIVKDEHSHPGDCMGYLASLLFPAGKQLTKKNAVTSQVGNYFNRAPGIKAPFIGAKGRGVLLPKEARTIGRPGAKVNRELPYRT